MNIDQLLNPGKFTIPESLNKLAMRRHMLDTPEEIKDRDEARAGYTAISREQMQQRIRRLLSPRGAKALIAKRLNTSRQRLSKIGHGTFLPPDEIAAMVGVKISRGASPQFLLSLDAKANQQPLAMPVKPTKQAENEARLRAQGYERVSDAYVRKLLLEKSKGMLNREVAAAVGCNVRTASQFRTGTKNPSVKTAYWLGLQVLWHVSYPSGVQPKRRFSIWRKRDEIGADYDGI